MAKVWKKLQRADADFTGNVSGSINSVAVSQVYTSSNKPTKSDVGLGNLDNTKFSSGKFIGVIAKADGTAVFDPSTGDFTGKISGETALNIKNKATAGNEAKDAVDGNKTITMVGGSLSIGTPASGVYPFSVDTSGNLKIKNDEFQALADGTVNCKGNFTINQDSNGDSKIVLAGDGTGQAEVEVNGANPTFDLGGASPLGTSTLFLKRKLTTNQARIQFQTGTGAGAMTNQLNIGVSNNTINSRKDQYAIHYGPIWSSGTAPERGLTFDHDGKMGMYANTKTVAGFTFGSDGTNKHVYIKDGGLGIGTANTNDGTLAVAGAGVSSAPIVATNSTYGNIQFAYGSPPNYGSGKLGIHSSYALAIGTTQSEVDIGTGSGTAIEVTNRDTGLKGALSVAGASTLSGNVEILKGTPTLIIKQSDSSSSNLEMRNSSGSIVGRLKYDTAGGNHMYLENRNAGNLVFETADIARLIINGVGNAGIGVTPETTNSAYDALQIGGNANITSYGTQGASGQVDFGHNYYFSASGTDKYISTDEATQLRQGGGAFSFRTAPSGTADNNITFTERMKITQAGLVQIGTTANSNSAKLGIDGNINIGNGQSSSLAYFENSGTDMYIEGNGSNLNIGSVGNTQYVRFPAGGGLQVPDGSVEIGTTVATDGKLRFPRDSGLIYARNAANNGNTRILGVDASNRILIATDGNASIFGGTVTATSFSGSGANLTSLPTQTPANGSITNAMLAGGIDQTKLAAASVKHAAMAQDAIEADNIKDGAVTADKLATNAIGHPSKIANDVIDSQHYTSRSIDTDHLEHQSVTAVKLNVSGNGGLTDFLKSDGDGSFSWATPPNSNTTYSIAAYDNNPASGIVLTPSSGSATTIEFTDGELYYNTDGNNIEAGISNNAVTANKIDSSAVTTAKIQNNAVTPAKANLGWHTQTKIFVSPEEFSPNDHQNYGNVAIHSNGGSARMTYSAIEGYANVMIPSGYKVTHFRINGTSSVSISAHTSTCAVSSETSVSPPTSLFTNTTYQTNPTTGISADDTNGKYFILGWLPTATNKYLYGAILTIAKI